MVAGQLLDPIFRSTKNLWTSTYVLFNGGLPGCCWRVLIGLRIYAVNKWVTPFLVFGNMKTRSGLYALAAIVLGDQHRLCIRRRPVDARETCTAGYTKQFFVPYMNPKNLRVHSRVVFWVA